MLYPQNGGRVVALVFVTSLHAMYYNMQDVKNIIHYVKMTEQHL